MSNPRAIMLEQPGLLTVARASRGAKLKCSHLAKQTGRLFVLSALASLVGFGAWAGKTEITSVTRAAGTVIPPVRNQVVQHLEGGIVSKIMVAEGDRVVADDALMRLEDSRWTAALEQTRIELATKRVQRERLLAEANGSETFEPTRDSLAAQAVATERTLFIRRRATLEERAAIYDDQIRRFELERTELAARQTNLEAERILVNERVGSLRRLAERQAVSRNELLSALTTLQQLDTKIADAANQAPQVETELEETRKRKREIFTAARADSAALLADVELEIAQLEETAESMRDRETRSDVRSPVAGVVNKLFIGTVGGIVAAGQEIAEIVPDAEALTVEARLAPSDRGNVWPGMEAVLKVTAYDYSVYGGVQALVEDISADVVSDENGESFFRIRLSADQSDFGPNRPILPGMVVDVDMLADDRTVLEALIEPLVEIRDTALRE